MSSGRPRSYQDFIEETVRAGYDAVARRPWRLDRRDRAWMLKADARGVAEHGVPPGQVYDDLRAAMRGRARNPLWILSIVPGILYVLFQVLRGLVVWKAYAWFLGARYVPEARRALERRSRAPAPDGSRPSAGGPGSGAAAPPSRRAPPLASVVILSHDRLSYLQTTIGSLLATIDRDRVEIIVVDNGSTDGSAGEVRRLAEAGVIDRAILRGRNHGTSPGFNIGFAHADRRCRFLVKLDSDIVLLTPGWLERFQRFLDAHPRVGAVAQTQINHGMLRWAPQRLMGGERVSSWNWFVCGGACMTIPRRVFDDVGWLNEGFTVPYMPDDLDYATRLFYLGYEAYYLQGCVAYHRADLDAQRFRAHGRSKSAQRRKTSLKQELEMYRAYAGGKDPRVRYDRYEACAAPDGARILTME
jgi:GT2 family glycosyltransferase